MIKTLTYRIHEVVPYINWIYFFHAWGFPSRYADVTQNYDCEVCRHTWVSSLPENERPKANEASKLYQEALSMLSQMDGALHAYARFAILEANSDGDDIIFYLDNKDELIRLPLLRQQITNQEVCLCLADFIRPTALGRDTAGVFAATVDANMEVLYQSGNEIDPYKHLLVQTLADRLAEAAAEKMHEEVRRKYWGYATGENLSIQDLHNEQFIGIRPAVGYPSLPDQSSNFELDKLIDFKQIGIHLTESGAMQPHASVSGLMLAHPSARYFAVGKIGIDQLEDYAKRKHMTVEKVRTFLAANT